MIIVRAPYRISLFGGGSDYPEFISKYGYGSIISAAIDKYCYITVNDLLPFHKHRSLIRYNRNERVFDSNLWISHPIIRNCLKFCNIDDPLEITHLSDVVGGSGLGTSSTMIVTLLKALYEYQNNLHIYEYDMLKDCSYIERNMMGEVVGFQDYLPAINGGLRDYSITETTIHSNKLPNKFNNIINNYGLLFYTGVSRKSSNIVSKYIDKIAISPAQLEIRNIAEEAYEEIANECQYEKICRLLNDSYAMKILVSPEIHTSEVIDKMKTLWDKGIDAIKLLGAGGGGSIFCLASRDIHYNIIKTAQEVGMVHIPFKIVDKGVERIL